MTKLDMENYSWVISGSQRRRIIKSLDKERTPTEIAEKSGISLNNTSSVLRAFKKHGIAKCINEKAKTGRLYELTSKGKLIKDRLREEL